MGQGSLSSWVISNQASLRDFTFDKDARTFDGQVIVNTSLTQDLTNIRFINCFFEGVVLENLVSIHNLRLPICSQTNGLKCSFN